MNRIASFLLVGLGALGGAPGLLAQPASIHVSLVPTPQIISAGADTTLDVVVSGLGDHVSPSVGAFSFTFSYNSSIVLANSVTFGTYLNLGDPLDSFQLFDLTTPGVFSFETSFVLDPADLNAAQPSSFTLATIGFHGVAAGTTSVDLFDPLDGSLSDELSNTLDFDFTGASITVESSGPGPIPEPATVSAAVVLGLLVGGTVLKLRRSR